ncbi:MAG TPA: type II CAAX endopeptidase family protein [Rhizomicrobium sp.]|nr:type II CAAX endopeptidase family protein [Rhizomicrobium sp.]
MVRFLKSLPFALEFAIVAVLAFGPFTVRSLLVASRFVASPYQGHAATGLLHTVLFEIVILAILLPFLYVRGWTFAKIGLEPTFKDTGIGVLLFVATYVVWYFVWAATVLVSPQTAAGIMGSPVITGRVPPAIALAIGLINPFFEEMLVCGYVMTALGRDNNQSLAINASVALRVSYHLYQGPRGVLSIIPFGLIFSFWYARTGRLWPLVVAHTMSDLLALLMIGSGQ